jgi:hypothetical protein
MALRPSSYILLLMAFSIRIGEAVLRDDLPSRARARAVAQGIAFRRGARYVWMFSADGAIGAPDPALEDIEVCEVFRTPLLVPDDAQA